ncbi:MAG: hypothetical protein RLZZ227_455 [Pseudomonadota bacterium]
MVPINIACDNRAAEKTEGGAHPSLHVDRHFMNQKILSLLPPFALLCIGLGSAWVGSSYDIGTLTAMGPGFLPVALGLCLAALAGLLLWQEKPADVEFPIALRPVLFVSAGIIAWVLLADSLGFFPAAIAQLLLSAFALPNQNWRTLGFVTVLMSIGAYLLFVKLLGMPLPAFGS